VKRTLIIGLGNTLRGDDGAGVRAAERLAAEFPRADLALTQGLHPELAERMNGCHTVLFIDASVDVHRLAVALLDPPASPTAPGTHTVSPEELLAVCARLFPSPPLQTFLIEIPAFSCDFSEHMTPATERMVDLCVELLGEFLAADASFETHVVPHSALTAP
jgi:hydrogenase maturation protease